jgi:hypothetical protein
VTSGPSLPLVLRALAVTIVALALLDPSLPSGRYADRVVAVVSAEELGADRAATAAERDGTTWVDRVAERMADRFTVIRGAYPGASATVLAGDHLPAALTEGDLFLASPIFLAHPDPVGAGTLPPVLPRVTRVEAPRRVSPESLIPVHAWIARGNGDPMGTGVGETEASFRATLRMDGVVVSDTVFPGSVGDSSPAVLRFEVVPSRRGPLPLRLEVTGVNAGDGTAHTSTADFLVDVAPREWRVLFFDGRPSWMSTFVRRAVESDPRFAVRSRTVTSPGLATQFGAPPASLGTAGALDSLDVVVVGAPELLSESDTDALQAFMEMRGGSVLLLLDREASGPHDRLTGVTSWTRGGGAEPVRLTPDARGGLESPGLHARSMIWPDPLPPAGRAVVTTPAGDPVVWRRPGGKGRLIVSGALDNWQFRDPETTHFEPVWREIVGEAADLAPRALEAEWIGSHQGGGWGIGAASGIAPPGGVLRFGITLRDAPAPGTSVTAVATLAGSAGGSEVPVAGGDFDRMVPLWPTEVPGRFEGRLRTPVAPGPHRMDVLVEVDGQGGGEQGGGRLAAALPLVVLADAAPPPPDDPALMAAWAASRGGTLRASDELADLEAEILQAVGAEGPSDPWHPMRSPWWILPLALLLGGEWAWRRRRGLP